MPFAIKENGIVVGVSIILLAGLAASLGLYFQGLCTQFVAAGHASFFQLSKITYPSLSVVFDVAIAVKCFGVGVSYLIIIGDLMPQIVGSLGVGGDGGLLAHRAFWILVSMVIAGPLSFSRHLDALKYTSVVALLAVGYLVITVIFQFFHMDKSLVRGDINVWAPQSFGSVLSVLPVIVFAFTCHQNMFASLNELPQRRESNVRKIVLSSIGPAAVVYIAVGLAGYLTFGNTVGGNIIAMYPYSLGVIIGQIAIVVLVLFSYPLQCHPCRASVINIISWVKSNNAAASYAPIEDEADEEAGNGADHAGAAAGALHLHLHESPVYHLAITTVIIALSLALALRVHSLEVMLAFVGSTGSTSISFILPGIFTYKLLSLQKAEAINPAFRENFYGIKNLDEAQAARFTPRDEVLRITAVSLFFFGVTVLVVCLGINIVHFA